MWGKHSLRYSHALNFGIPGFEYLFGTDTVFLKTGYMVEGRTLEKVRDMLEEALGGRYDLEYVFAEEGFINVVYKADMKEIELDVREA